MYVLELAIYCANKCLFIITSPSNAGENINVFAVVTSVTIPSNEITTIQKDRNNLKKSKKRKREMRFSGPN